MQAISGTLAILILFLSPRWNPAKIAIAEDSNNGISKCFIVYVLIVFQYQEAVEGGRTVSHM